MNTKHPEGYWVKKLTDEQIEDIAKLLMSENQKFKKIEKPERKETEIIVKMHYEQTNTFLRQKESLLTIKDFSLKGKIHSELRVYDYLIQALGSEYAEELVDYLEECLKRLTNNSTYKSGVYNYKNKIEDDLSQHSL